MRTTKYLDRARLRSYLPVALGFVAGAVCVAVAACLIFNHSISNRLTPVRESNLSVGGSSYMFTDPLIGLSTGGVTSPDYAALQNQINSFVASQSGGPLFSVSVSFRDVLASEGFTTNPSAVYDPASLSKVPLAMAYYAIAEEDSSVMSDEIYYSGSPDLDANEQVKSPTQLVPGRSYTVAAMIEHLIKYSDNNAEQLLADHLAAIGKLDVLTALFSDLGIKTNPSTPDYASVGQYSIFLRVLYNATYLNRADSEALLKLLSESDFAQGIEAGVPNSIVVSQKFGDARIPDQSGAVVGAELHDCGIVYYPDHPYLLCVMTKGSSVASLEPVISGISNLVYRYVANKYPESGTE